MQRMWGIRYCVACARHDGVPVQLWALQKTCVAHVAAFWLLRGTDKVCPDASRDVCPARLRAWPWAPRHPGWAAASWPACSEGGGARQGSARLAAHPPTAAAALRQRLVPRPLHSQLPSGPAPQPEARRSAAAGMTRQLGVRVPSPFAWRAPVPSPPARPTPWSPGS